jgi:hypothetical protein
VGEPAPDFSKAFSKVIPFFANAASKEFNFGSSVLVLAAVVAFSEEPEGAGTFKLAAFACLLYFEQGRHCKRGD